MKTPIILKELVKLSNRNMISFHVPGHKNGKIFNKYNIDISDNIARYDITELPGTDNLHAPEGMIKEAQERAKIFYGADHTFFLVNGTTSGVISMIMSVTNPGDKIIVPRNCHKSVINGMILGGVTPVYVKPEICSNFFISMGITPESIERAIKKHPDAKALIITYPNYYGICCDIEKIADIVHKHNKILLVDEAHGSHLKLSDKLPISALDAGADIVVQSIHKTLPSFTQSSILHVRDGRMDLDKLKFMLSINQSSSPSYLLMVSLDIAMTIITDEGNFLIQKLINNIDIFRKKINKLKGIEILSQDVIGKYGVKNIDITKLTVNMKDLKIEGTRLEQNLRNEYNIQVEMADIYNILAVSSIANDKNDFDGLFKALKDIHDNKRISREKLKIPEFSFTIPDVEITPREAVYRKKESVQFTRSVGRISGDYITPYPPGVPLICPGEIIREETIQYIKMLKDFGINIMGINSDSLKINVIK